MRGFTKISVVGTVALLVGALVGLLQAGSASAAGYPVTTCASLSVSTTTPHVGEQITVGGKNFNAGDSVTLVLTPAGATLGHVTANASGSFTTRVRMPSGSTGPQKIVAEGATVTCSISPIGLQVASAGNNGGQPGGHGTGSGHNGGSGGGNGSGSSGGHTPFFTGVNSLLLIIVAAVLIGGGALIARGGRRRRAAA